LLPIRWPRGIVRLIVLSSMALSAMAAPSFAQSQQDKPDSPGPAATDPAAQNPPATAQDKSAAAQNPQPPAGAPAQQPDNPKRILGIIPNFQTTNDKSATPKALTPKEKYTLAYHQIFDVSAHIGNALQAGIQQATNGEPHYGEGWGAYAERFAAAEGDQFSSSFLIYGFLPSILHDDPRYFRRGHGSPGSRLWYAITRTVVTRTDAQTPTFNAPLVFGQLGQAGISNLYYPKQDRNVEGTFTTWGVNLAYNSMYNVLKEYYPDFLRILKHRKREYSDPNPPAKDTANH
jgi:hypothetical protein